jgi:nitrite reductase/ring-hydroxylating ferredoxin subunit
MAFVKVAALSELAPGTLFEVMVNEQPIALCNVKGELHALAGTCPHRGGPLGQGAVNGDFVTCPWHAWDFDCRTGENDFDPRHKVAVFAVKEEAGSVFVDVP